jgi:hypothetical protein
LTRKGRFIDPYFQNSDNLAWRALNKDPNGGIKSFRIINTKTLAKSKTLLGKLDAAWEKFANWVNGE